VAGVPDKPAYEVIFLHADVESGSAGILDRRHSVFFQQESTPRMRRISDRSRNTDRDQIGTLIGFIGIPTKPPTFTPVPFFVTGQQHNG
jgi:hypothetical protein